MMVKWRVINGDCREVLPTIPIKFDFIFADPPFNIDHGYKGFKDKCTPAEYRDFTVTWVLRCWDALKPTGILCLHGPDAVAVQYLELELRYALPRIAWINWHYRFGQCHRANWIDARCHCLVYAKDPENYTWNPDAVLVPSDRVAYGDKRTQQAATPGLRLPGTVWGVPSDGPYWGRVQGNSTERRKDHPNQLPEVYLERLIRAYTNPRDVVFDPFCGSGTTATVAVELGRSCVTIDVSRENCVSARERIVGGPKRIRSL